VVEFETGGVGRWLFNRRVPPAEPRMGQRHLVEPTADRQRIHQTRSYIEGPSRGLWRRNLGTRRRPSLPGAQQALAELAGGRQRGSG